MTSNPEQSLISLNPFPNHTPKAKSCKSFLRTIYWDSPQFPQCPSFLNAVINNPNLFNYRCVPGGLWLEGIHNMNCNFKDTSGFRLIWMYQFTQCIRTLSFFPYFRSTVLLCWLHLLVGSFFVAGQVATGTPRSTCLQSVIQMRRNLPFFSGLTSKLKILLIFSACLETYPSIGHWPGVGCTGWPIWAQACCWGRKKAPLIVSPMRFMWSGGRLLPISEFG